MDLTTRVLLQSSEVHAPSIGSSLVPADPDTRMTAVILLRRPTYNGLTMRQYADQIVSGAHNNTLSYGDFSKTFSATPEDCNLVQEFARVSGLVVIETNPAATLYALPASAINWCALFSNYDERQIRGIPAEGSK